VRWKKEMEEMEEMEWNGTFQTALKLTSGDVEGTSPPPRPAKVMVNTTYTYLLTYMYLPTYVCPS
jgi:hypothetical protein